MVRSVELPPPAAPQEMVACRKEIVAELKTLVVTSGLLIKGDPGSPSSAVGASKAGPAWRAARPAPNIHTAGFQ
eukprot:5030835-Alexandrium_andersonii.AAC.1